MTPAFFEDVTHAVRETVEHAVGSALVAFAEAAVTAFAQVTGPEFVRTHSHAGADATADALAAIFVHDLGGAVASEVDASGVHVGAVRVDTRLVAFASGEHVASPIEKISVEHAFPLDLASRDVRAGELSASGTLTVKTTCAFDDRTGKPKPATSVEIALDAAWSSERKDAAVR
jgi:hypothetical protein